MTADAIHSGSAYDRVEIRCDFCDCRFTAYITPTRNRAMAKISGRTAVGVRRVGGDWCGCDR